MKKPNFNPMFYSLNLYKIFKPGEKPNEPTSVKAESIEKKEITNEDRTKVLDYISTRASIIQGKSAEAHGIFEKNASTFQFTKGFVKVKKELETLKSAAARKIYSMREIKELEAYQIVLLKNLDKIERDIDTLKNKIELHTKLKEKAQEEIKRHLDNWENDVPPGIKKAASRREVLIVVTGYIGRWYKVNSAAIDRITDMADSGIILNGFNQNPPKGELFEDLKTLNKEIENEVYARWITGLEHKDVLRTVFSKLGWEDKFIKEIKDIKLRKLVQEFNESRQIGYNRGARKDYKDIVDALVNYIGRAPR